MKLNRRRFLAATAATALAAPAIHAQSKGKTYRTALIGCGWWGMNILNTALENKDVKCVAMCDVDRPRLETVAAEVANKTGNALKAYGDYRELIKNENPDIVIVGTPDHWHALPTIAALEAGAHVYVEKPISHTIGEGQAMVAAARANQRKVQVGTHRRVSPHNLEGMKMLREGKVGKVGMVRAFVHYGGGAGKPTPDSETPKGLDWDMWCGPGPLVPYNKTLHPKGFRNHLDYANGMLGDWGIHWLDQILWWSDEPHPKYVHSTGGRFISQDNTTAPDCQVVNYEFENFTAVWEHRRFAANNAEKHNIGCYFYGTAGTLHIGWLDGLNFYPSDKRKEPFHMDPTLNEPDQQNIRGLWADLMKCIKTGGTPVCDIEIGHRSTVMALLGMMSLKIGRGVAWNGEKGKIEDDREASKLLVRQYRKPWKYPKA